MAPSIPTLVFKGVLSIKEDHGEFLVRLSDGRAQQRFKLVIFAFQQILGLKKTDVDIIAFQNVLQLKHLFFLPIVFGAS